MALEGRARASWWSRRRGLQAYGGAPVIRDFSTASSAATAWPVGPNGAGKTTLVKLLTGEIAPDTGTVRLGTGLEIAVFDQNRAALDPEATLWESLTGDPPMRRPGRNDQVMVRGQPAMWSPI
jgi:ATP-binding cassette subfamily F protein uup